MKNEKNHLYKYLLCPGYNDDGIYFGLSGILKMYHVPPHLCLIPGASGSDNKNLIKLKPR
jgi:hypothetical protein